MYFNIVKNGVMINISKEKKGEIHMLKRIEAFLSEYYDEFLHREAKQSDMNQLNKEKKQQAFFDRK